MHSSSRYPGLDFLRAIAIVWVMLFHFRPLQLPAILYWPSRYGWMGVDLFFVLSGYLIGSQLLRPYLSAKRPALGDFYMRRAFRILPAFLVVLALYVLVPGFREAPRLSPVWQFFTFTLNYRIDYLHNQAFSHFWSLCVEEHFYVVLPVLILLLMRKPSFGKATVVASGILLFGIAARWYTYSHQLHPLVATDKDGFYLGYLEKIYYPTHTRLDGLLTGVVLAGIKSFRPLWWQQLTHRGHFLTLSGLSVCGLAMWLFHDRSSLSATLFGFPLISFGLGILVLASVSPNSYLARLRGFGWLATLAYSTYLTHKEIAHLDQRYFGVYLAAGSWVAFFVYFVTCFLGAAILYLAVERPFLRLRERISARAGIKLQAAAAANA